MIKTYQGADALKNGITDNVGYCMAVTAKRNNMRLLAIVLGEKEGKVRNKEIEEVKITVSDDLKKDNYFNIFMKILKGMITGDLF